MRYHSAVGKDSEGGLRQYLARGFTRHHTPRDDIYYRNGCDFLLSPDSWVRVSVDDSVIPVAELYAVDGACFVQRDFLIQDDPDTLKGALSLSLQQHNVMRMEAIMGVRLLDHDCPAVIYHTSSPGIPLNMITNKSPPVLVKNVAGTLARAMRELHDAGWQYGEAVPTNMKYDPSDIIILSPVSAMQKIPQPDMVRRMGVEDLGIILATHAYINDREAFIADYEGERKRDKHFAECVLNYAEGVPSLVHSGEITLADVWHKQLPNTGEEAG